MRLFSVLERMTICAQEKLSEPLLGAKMKVALYLALILLGCLINSTTFAEHHNEKPQLVRLPYTSIVDDVERDYFLYLPNGYKEDKAKQWPVLVYLHGDGERGNGKEDLDYVLGYGPLYEAWIQKKDFAVHYYCPAKSYVWPRWPCWPRLHSQPNSSRHPKTAERRRPTPPR